MSTYLVHISHWLWASAGDGCECLGHSLLGIAGNSPGRRCAMTKSQPLGNGDSSYQMGSVYPIGLRNLGSGQMSILLDQETLPQRDHWMILGKGKPILKRELLQASDTVLFTPERMNESVNKYVLN